MTLEPIRGTGHRPRSADPEQTTFGLRLAGVAVENIAEGIVITDAQTRILAVNRSFTKITGYEASEVVGQQPGRFQSQRHDRAFYETMREALLDCGQWRGEIWNRRKSGAIYPAQLSVSVVKDDFGQIANFVGVFADTSALEASEARFEHLAHHDPFTGLPNRLLFTSRGEHALVRARRSGGRCAVMYVDLDFDRFENLDDTIGRPAGEGLLPKVAERFAACVGAGDTIGRLGGDEFTVLLEELPAAGSAAVVANEMLEALATPFSVAGNELFVSACIGVSVFPEDGDDFATLVKQASTAMHRAMEQGRGSLQFYTAELTRAALERFRLERDLRRALKGDELVLHFQPQVSVRTGAVVGAEALVRWNHPELGLVLPSQFIPLAEETGLAEAIGAWVLRAACRQARSWVAQGLPPLRVAVNLSAREICVSPLTDQIAATLADTGLDPALLEIEITEGSVMAHFDAAVATLESIKRLGVTIALDDFGTGHSSLNHLRHFPIDRLKLDGSFVRQIAHDQTSQAIARAAIALGHGLRLDVVAEGVETPTQLEHLRSSRCDAYQGHLFAAALPPEGFAAMIREMSA